MKSAKLRYRLIATVTISAAMKKAYEGWVANGSVTFAPAENIPDLRQQGLLEPDAKFLHRIEAETFEEALAVHHLRTGKPPFVPMGKPAQCPKGCGAYFYPEGSGECPNCGKIC